MVALMASYQVQRLVEKLAYNTAVSMAAYLAKHKVAWLAVAKVVEMVLAQVAYQVELTVFHLAVLMAVQKDFAMVVWMDSLKAELKDSSMALSTVAQWDCKMGG